VLARPPSVPSSPSLPRPTVQELIRKHVRPDDAVYEFGARFGTAACEVSSVLRNSGRQVAIEPDADVWGSLLRNRASHYCNFWLLRGVISDSAYTIKKSSDAETWATRVSFTGKEDSTASERKSLTFAEVMDLTGVVPTVLIIDCEGCLNSIFRGADLSAVLAPVRVVIMEADNPGGMSDKSYEAWETTFAEHGFSMKEKSVDKMWGHDGVLNYVFSKAPT
jgi:FkbM family methyltransferase